MEATTHAQGVDAFITRLAGTSVQIREPRPGAWVAVPLDKAQMRSKIWQALRSGPQQGVGRTAQEAAILLALAVGAAGPAKTTKQQKAQQWLQALLSNGAARTVAEVHALAKEQGISLAALDRAARSIGVLREKCGLQGPWIWSIT